MSAPTSLSTRAEQRPFAIVLALAVAGLMVAGSLFVAAPAGADDESAQSAAASGDTISRVGQVARDELHVMSFNLRFASDEPPHSWPERRPVMQQLLRTERPHIIGTQEGLYQQLLDLENDLPPYYETIGTGRDGGSQGEFMHVFYDSRRLQPLEFDHYWLSDTPDMIGSQTWEGCCARMVTWVRFLDTNVDEEFYLFNTHFEAFDADTRAKSADLVLEKMDEQFDPELPVLSTGDFNEAAADGETVFDTLVTDGPFVDTWDEADVRSDLWATFHGYNPLTPDGDRIDWVITTDDVESRIAFINTFERGGQFPSDHLPVQAVVSLPQS